MQKELFGFISRFIELTEDETKTLAEMNLFRSYRKGEILLREGEFSDKSYLVLRGCLRSYYIIDGEEKTTAFFIENEPLLPVCATTKEASPYYISCVEDVVLWVSAPETEQSFFEKFPRFEAVCLKFSEQMMARNQMSFERYMNSTPEQRYLFLMDERPELLQRVPQYQLASYLGIQPQSLSRIRRRLAKK